MIKKKVIEKEVERTIKPAHYKHIDTNHKKVIKVINEHGDVEEKERPIYDRVFIDAVKETIIERTDVWAVNDGVDEHHFTTEAEAKNFSRGVN